MKKVLHISYSMDTGGGPLTIKRIVEDFKDYEYFVSGNKGVFMDYFSKVLSPGKLLYLKGMNLPLNLWMICRFCARHKIDIVHVHGRGAASFARFVKLFRPSTKIIYTPNGFFPDSLTPIKRRLYLILERFLFSFTDLVFFVSRSEQAMFSTSIPGLNESKFIYIQNYLTPTEEYFNPLPYAHDSTAKVKFLFIGRLSPQKGVDILIEALKKVRDKDFHVTVVGYGEDEEYLRKEISNPPLQGKVTFLGKVHEAYRLMPNFDALLLSSRFEGLPFTILEAMWFRLPLVVTPAQGIVDLLNENNSYISAAIESSAYSEKIDRFMEDFTHNRPKIDSFVSANFSLLKTEYSREAVKDKIDRLYAG